MTHANPDQALIAAVLAGRPLPCPLDTNPFAIALGTEVLEVGPEGRLVLAFTPGEQFLQGNGVVHGGIVSAMMDFAMGICPFPLLAAESTTATSNLTVAFLRPALPGRLVVTVTVDRLGRTTGFTHAAMVDDRGRLIATGMSTVAVVAARPS